MDSEALRARREERRRAILRRRRAVLALIATVAVLVAAVVVLATGGSGADSPGRSRASSLARAGTPASRGGADSAGGAGTGTTTATTAGASAGPPGNEPVPILMYHVIAAPPAGAPFPGLYVATGGVRRTDAGAQERRLARGDARPGRGLLAARRAAGRGQADRGELRQRLQLPVHAGTARAAPARLGGR